MTRKTNSEHAFGGVIVDTALGIIDIFGDRFRLRDLRVASDNVGFMIIPGEVPKTSDVAEAVTFAQGYFPI